MGSPGSHISQIWTLQIPLSSDCFFFCGSVFLFHLTSSTMKQIRTHTRTSPQEAVHSCDRGWGSLLSTNGKQEAISVCFLAT